MTKRWGVPLAVLLTVGIAAPSAGSAQEEEAVMAAVEQIFDGMRTANADMVRAVFAPDARFASLSTRSQPPTISVSSVEGWLGGIENSGGAWDEQIYDVEIRVDDYMASAWVPFTFYFNGELSHCGVNAIEFLKDSDGWKVTQLTDTRRSENCPDPHGR